MEVSQHIAKLLAPFHHPLKGLSAAMFQQMIQAVSLNVFHDNHEAVVRLNHVENLGEVRMLKALKHIRRSCQFLFNYRMMINVFLSLLNLPNRKRFVRLFIDCKIYFAYGVKSDLCQNLILFICQSADLEHDSQPSLLPPVIPPAYARDRYRFCDMVFA